MKTQIFMLLVILLASGIPIFGQEKIDAEITYINNEGFMISNNAKKVFIDALYYYSYGAGIPNTEPYLRDMIMKDEKPFDGSELFMITHNHPDHYDQTMMSSYLERHQKSVLVADSSIIKPLVSKFGTQLFSSNPPKYASVDTIVNGFPLTAYNLLHDVGYRIYNVGYLVDIDGLTIFHSGDNTLEDSTEYIKSGLEDKAIDIAFLNHNGFLKSPANSDFFKKHLNTKCIILMHIPDNLIETVKAKVANLPDGFPPVFVFSSSMEKISFNDSIYFTNLSPVKVGGINDTIIAKGSQFSLKIPELFSDPDKDDSVTYSVTGLPTGLTFDNQKMLIYGTVEKTGKSSIKITGTDQHFSANSLTFKLTVNELSGNEINGINKPYIYPNPAQNNIWFSQLSYNNNKIQIYNVDGRKVLDQSLCENHLDISKLDKGIFVIKLIDSEKTTTYNLIKR